CMGDGSDDEDDDDDDDDDAARTITDASTASSLLWGEDMTLTSVSEEEALAIKWFGLHRPPVRPQQLRWQQERQ
ncbi:hypothetical protein JZU48_04530, partial [bacterium]|nr:hypothetical protein [bacterium]